MRIKNISYKEIKKASSSEEIFLYWSNLVTSACLFILYSITLAYLGLFYGWLVLLGLLFILVFNRSYKAFQDLLKIYFQENFDKIRFIIIMSWMVWFLVLLVFAPYPAFSGRDEGSYANAAVYLAKFHNINFHLPLLDHFKAEGLAHQSLNFPGFVITNGNLTSQFSPAYYTFLATFYSLTGSVGSFILANGLLVLGGMIGFYLLLRLFSLRWVATAGFLALLFNFLFLWVPRYTFSENMAFFLFPNLVYFICLFRKTKALNYLYPVIAILVLFPLTRPEGWWLLIATIILFAYWYKKGIFILPKISPIKTTLALLGGVLLFAYTSYTQFPVYKRLIRDWIKWPATSANYLDVAHGNVSFGNIKQIVSAFFPNTLKFLYFLRVEWNYGVLIFGLIATITLIIYIFYRNKSVFSEKADYLIGFLAFLSFPFFGAFISPQISADHPWMLRRFFFVILPCGILASIVLISVISEKVNEKVKSVAAPILLALLVVPSLFASVYFVFGKTDTGREEVIEKIASGYAQDDYLFFTRESSGDGWHMWADPLSSIFGLNSVYVYSPDNIIENKQLISDRFLENRKSYLIIPGNAFDYEHKLSKTFNLVLDKEITFANLQYQNQSGAYNADFPQLERKIYTTKVYLLIPR